MNCHMVQAFPLNKHLNFDYSDYGDYLLLKGDDIERRVQYTARQMKSLFRLMRSSLPDASTAILDFGSGAGYLCKAAERFGFRVFGVELSDKLRAFSKEQVGFSSVYRSLDEIDQQFGAVMMSDVIEHFHPQDSRKLLTAISSKLCRNGLLLGNTPNVESLNIKLCGTRDPVVAPPSHQCYFSLRTLDKYLGTLGLSRVKIYSQGLSSDSFFRKSKFEPSFLEIPFRQAPMYQWPVLVSLKAAFAAAGYMVQPFGWGYQIYFVYRKSDALVR